MKRIFYVLMAATLLLAACEREEPSINVSMDSIEAPSDGLQQQVTISCNRSWTATASEPWISLSPESGSKGEANLDIRIEPNTGSSARSGSVSVTCGGLIRYITIRQAQPFRQQLSISHNRKSMTAPDFRGTGLVVEVDWGDGTVVPWRSGIDHGYESKGPYTISMKIAGAQWFQVTDVTGISEIDLSGF